MIGKIATWNLERGFGFVEIESGGKFFVHCSNLADRSCDHLSVGMRVSFDVARSERRGKLHAVNAAVLTGGEALPRPSPRETAQTHFRSV